MQVVRFGRVGFVDIPKTHRVLVPAVDPLHSRVHACVLPDSLAGYDYIVDSNFTDNVAGEAAGGRRAARFYLLGATCSWPCVRCRCIFLAEHLRFQRLGFGSSLSEGVGRERKAGKHTVAELFVVVVGVLDTPS